MKAIIIAAGQGTRLRPHTDTRPKCMVEVAGRPLLRHQVTAFNLAGIHDVVVIRGYRGRAIDCGGVRFVDNRRYPEHQILMSLFSARAELCGDVLISYGDIIYRPEIAGALAEAPTPGCLVIDELWADAYEGRTDHPVEQAELCQVAPGGQVLEVGKQVGPERAFGEFIGFARFSGPLLARLCAIYFEALSRPDAPFGAASSLREAYLTDLVNEAIKRGESFSTLPIEGGWREIDTVQDFERAQAAVDW